MPDRSEYPYSRWTLVFTDTEIEASFTAEHLTRYLGVVRVSMLLGPSSMPCSACSTCW